MHLSSRGKRIYNLCKQIDDIHLETIDYSKELDCSICYEYMDQASCYDTKCGHLFHIKCITTFYINGNSCPLCRCDLRGYDIENNCNRILEQYNKKCIAYILSTIMIMIPIIMGILCIYMIAYLFDKV